MTIAPSFAHLRHLTDDGGLYEHALHAEPRPEHGYCVDDVARGLVVVCRDRRTARENADLRASYLLFVLEAQSPDGRFRNRRATDLAWSGNPSVEDCWGRALWGLGAVVAGRGDAAECRAALAAFFLGWAHEGAGNARGALSAWRSAAHLDPTLVSAHLALADGYLRLANPALAVQALKAGLAALPASPELQSRLAQLERRQ